MPLFEYDPEKVDPETREKIESATECMLYFMINTCGATRWRSKHDSADGRPWAPSIADSIKLEEEMFHIQRCCIERLKELDIVKEPVEDDGTPTQDYWKWFRWWKSYVEDLSEKEWREFDTAMNAYEDVSKWRPEGDWRDYEL